MIPVTVPGLDKPVLFPDGTPPDKIKFAIENDILPRIKPVQATMGDDIDKAAMQAQKPSGLERFGRGFADVAQGVKQGGLMLKDLVTGGNEAGAYTAEKTDELNRYERGRGPDAGFDAARLGGNILATIPAMAIPGGAASGLGTRMAASAAQGAAASGAMFTPEGESKGGQVALGALIGGAVPAVIEGGRRTVAGLIKQGGQVPISEVQQQLTDRLGKSGVDFSKLTQGVQESLVSDAQKALSVGGSLDDVMLANKAAIESVGAKPTTASLTRNPKDWQVEKNLRGITGVGEPIAKREAENAAAMTDYLAALRAKTGGKAGTAYEAGESAVNAIKAQDAAKEAVVDKLYNAYRSAGGADVAVPDTKLAATLGRVADEVGTENIPPAVMARLKEFGLLDGTRTKLLTVNEADKLNRLINNNNPGFGTASKALAPLKQALNESLLDVPAEGATQALMTARAAAAQRFKEQGAAKGIGAALDDVAPDRFVKKFILDADVRDLRGTLAELRKSPDGAQAIADIKGHLFDSLLLKATGATNVDDVAGRAFSGRNFSKSLDAIQPEKLHQLFTPSELESLRQLQKASKLLTEEVPYSDVNYSKTAAGLANLLQKIGNTPIVSTFAKPIIGAFGAGDEWMKNANARKAVAEAILGSAGTSPEKLKLPVSRYERILPAAASVLAEPGDKGKQ